jgi:hypothetical protein
LRAYNATFSPHDRRLGDAQGAHRVIDRPDTAITDARQCRGEPAIAIICHNAAG